MATHPLPADVHQAIVELIDAGSAFALVTVLKDAGSTPRKAGTKALVDAAGDIWGTIGGGLLESDARRAAVEAVRSGRPAMFDFRFSGTSARGDDPVCGGMMRILIDPTARERREVIGEAAAAARGRRRGLLLTVVEGRQTPQVTAQWLDDGAAPPAGGAAAAAVDAARSREAPQYFNDESRPDGGVEGLAEPLVPPPLLLIAGGGHVAQALARQASLLDFQVALADDRPEFADPALYPPAVDVVCGRFGEVAARWPANRDTYVAVVGRGHKVDADALAAVIHQPVGYIGMMGSRRKIALLRKEFTDSGLATEQQFARVHAPIGLDIGAQTVEEIAASIIAEVIAVRRGKARPARRVSG